MEEVGADGSETDKEPMEPEREDKDGCVLDVVPSDWVRAEVGVGGPYIRPWVRGPGGGEPSLLLESLCLCFFVDGLSRDRPSLLLRRLAEWLNLESSLLLRLLEGFGVESPSDARRESLDEDVAAAAAAAAEADDEPR